MDNEIRYIKRKLEAWGIKQQWLADKLGVKKSTFSLWINETYPMPKDKIEKAKKILSKIPEPKNNQSDNQKDISSETTTGRQEKTD